MEKCVTSFGYPAKMMAMFPIKGNNVETWRSELIAKLNSSV
jgi:hypothetical protein